jgi:hypothetical protein
MKRQTKQLLQLDQEVLLRALQNELIRVVFSTKGDITESVRNLRTENASTLLNEMVERMLDAQTVIGNLSTAIEETEENLGLDKKTVRLNFSVSGDLLSDDIPF